MKSIVYLVLLSCFVLFVGGKIHAQENCGNPQFELQITGSMCDKKGKVDIEVLLKTNGDSTGINLSENIYTLINPITMMTVAKSAKGSSLLKNIPVGGPYNIIHSKILCNGKQIEPPVDALKHFLTRYDLTITQAVYTRCKSSETAVTVKIKSGEGPFLYKIFDGDSLLFETTDPNMEMATYLNTGSDNLKVQVTDTYCNANPTKEAKLTRVNDHSGITSMIQGNGDVCAGTPIKFSAKNNPAGRAYRWVKNGTLLSAEDNLLVQQATAADAGEYSFSMTFESCQTAFSETFNVNVTVVPLPVTKSARACLSSPSFSLSKYASNTDGYNILTWYNSAKQKLSSAPTVTPGSPTTYTYYVTQSDATKGCESDYATVTVVIDNLPSAINSDDIFVCGGPGNPYPRIIISNAGDGLTYDLYDKASGGAKIASAVSVNDTARIETQNLVEGNTYYVETGVRDGCVSGSRTPVKISVKKTFVLGNYKRCFGDALALTADYAGVGRVSWTKPDNSVFVGTALTVPNVSNSEAGKYELKIETGWGCTIREQITVAVTRPAPPVPEKPSYVFRENEVPAPLKATATQGNTLKWYAPDGTLVLNPSGTPNPSPLPPTDATGTFIYNVLQDSAGCESARISVSVIVGEIPDSVASQDIRVCIAEKPVVRIDNTTPDYTYRVYRGNTLIAEGKGTGSTILLTSNVPIHENTVLTVTVASTLDIPSNETSKNYVSSNRLIDSANTDVWICNGSDGKLSASTIENATYLWRLPDGRIVAERTVEIFGAIASDAGQHTLSVAMPGCATVEQSINLKVEKPPVPEIPVGELYYCLGDPSANLNAIPLSGFRLEWFDSTNLQIADTPAPGTSVWGTNEYFVRQVSLTDDRCFSDKATIHVVTDSAPSPVYLDPIYICSGDGTMSVVTVPDSKTGYTYRLYSGATGGQAVAEATGENGREALIEIREQLDSATTYYLEIENSTGCLASERTPVDISYVSAYLSPDILPNYTIDEYYSFKLSTNLSNAEFDLLEGNLPSGMKLSSDGDIHGVIYGSEKPATFTVEARGTGCRLQKEYTLQGNVRVPKMFSPNGDMINDVFMPNNKVMIFDRHGLKIFEGDNGWDGNHDGKPMPEDVYFYIIAYEDEEGRAVRLTGHVTLIRNF